jgi:hypothetical protein
MSTIRHLIICVLIAAFVPAAHAQQPSSPFRIDTTKFVLQQCSSRNTWLEGIPVFAAAGAAIGALIGAVKAR